MPHPAVQAMESEVNKARDQLENQEQKLNRLEAVVKVERDEMKKLRRHLRNTKKLFEPEALRKTDLEEEAAEGDEPSPPEGVPEPSVFDRPRFSEHTYTKFRGGSTRTRSARSRPPRPKLRFTSPRCGM